MKKRIMQHIGGEFLPDNLTGLDLWLEADREVYSDPTVSPPVPAQPNDSVRQWRDRKTPTLYALQNTAGARPIYKSAIFGQQPALLFDGVDDYMSLAIAAAAASTIFLVCKDVASAANARILCGDVAATYALRAASGALGIYANQAGAVVDYTASIATNPNIVSANLASAASYLGYINGTQKINMDPDNTFASYTNLYLGSQLGSAAWANCYIGAIIRYNRSLSTSEQRMVELYLANKYGIALG